MFRVAVIGAGPAGCLAALLLARAGVRVALIEQHRFPRDKVCGECLSPLGVDVLNRCGLVPGLLNSGAVALISARLHQASGQSVRMDLPSPILALSRARLDSLLLAAARAAGVEVFQPARCEALEASELTIRDLESNALTRLRFDQALLGDGKSALLHPHPRPTQDLSIKAHFRNVRLEPGAVHLFGLPGHYGGIAPIEGSLWNLAFSVPRARLARSPDLDALLSQFSRENTSLRTALDGAGRVTDWLASPLPRFSLRWPWPPRVIPIGNAAAAIEPIGGEGMGLALGSAELAAGAIISSLKKAGGVNTTELAAAYRKLWRLRRIACRAAALWVSRPALCAAAVDLLDTGSSLNDLVLGLIGKRGSGHLDGASWATR